MCMFCIRKQIIMNMQWMKMKIPQTLMNMKIDVECWTFLHLLDAAHIIPDGILFASKMFSEAL